MSAGTKTLLKVLLTLALLAYLVAKMDLAQVRAVVSSARWSLVLVAVLIHFVTVALSLVRWSVIVSAFDMRVPMRRLLQFLLIGYYFNLFLPTSVGGDVLRAYYLARHENTWMPTTLTTTFLDRLIGLLAVLLVGTVGIVIHPIPIQGRSLLPLFLLLMAGFVVCLAVLFNDWTHRLLRRLLARLRRPRLEEKVEMLVGALKGFRRRPRAILVSVVLSVVIQFVVIAMAWVSALSLGMDAPFSTFVTFIPVINLTMMFPLTINGLGVRETVYYLLFSEIGVPVEQAVVLSLLTFVVMNVPSLIGGVVYLASDVPSKRDLAEGVEAGVRPAVD